MKIGLDAVGADAHREPDDARSPDLDDQARTSPHLEILRGQAEILGLEDPPCNAHGENESLHLGDFRKAAHASAHLLAELATPSSD